MKNSLTPAGTTALIASAAILVVFILMPLLAAAAAPSVRSADQQQPRFTSLQVEILPEFDRSGEALVILTGELAAEVALPATLTLRVPASSNPTAVAFATAPDSKLFNLEHERTGNESFITLRFSTMHRFIHVEFYDRISPDKPAGRFTYHYLWPGDLAVERLSVLFQEPATASDIQVKPDLGAPVKGPDGLLYRNAGLGAIPAGKQLPIEIGFKKTDPRTSSEILGLGTGVSTPPPTSASATAMPGWIPALVISAILLVAAGSALLWRLMRKKASGAAPTATGSCPRCGSRLAPDDRFCSRCGAAAPKR